MTYSISGTAKERTVELIVSKEADELERFAASELQGYLKQLFDVSATITNSPGKTAEYLVILGHPVVVQETIKRPPSLGSRQVVSASRSEVKDLGQNNFP